MSIFLLKRRRKFNKPADFRREGLARKIFLAQGKPKFYEGNKKVRIEGKNRAKNIVNNRN